LQFEEAPPQDSYEADLHALNQKVGGEAYWIQGDETPKGWRLLLQLGEYPVMDGASVDPTWNFGTGSAYVFISPDCWKGVFLAQC
jgi:hypothetical protein